MSSLLSRRRRVQTILQSQASECGLACLAMIANYHGHRIDLPYMRTLMTVSRRGMSMAQIAEIGDALGLDARGFALGSADELSKVSLPCILHWEGNHFVVLESIGRRGYVIHNPAIGRVVLSLADVREQFSGVVLELERRLDLEQIRNVRGNRLWPVLKSTKGIGSAIAILLLLSFAISLLGLMTPILLQVALDIVLPQFDLDLLTLVTAGLGLFMVFEAVGRWLRDLVVLRTSSLFQALFTRNVVGHAFRLPLSYFQQRHPGDFIARLDSINTVKATMVNGLVTSLADSLMAVLIVALMFYYSPLMTGLVLATMVLLIIMRFGFLPRVKEYAAASLVAHSRERAYLLDGLRQIEAVKVHNAGPAVIARWYDSLVRFVNTDYFEKRTENFVELLLHILFALSTIATLYIGVTDVMASTMSIGMLYAFFFLRQMFFERMNRVTTELMNLSVLGVHLRRIDDMIDEEAEQGIEDAGIDRSLRRTVALEAVTIRFAMADSPVLVDASLKIDIAKREGVAILGPSGSGKSSLLKVLASLHEPHEGSLVIDGMPVSRFGKREYRANLGCVFAEDGLFAATVAENLSLFDPDISMEAMEAALTTVGLWDAICDLPQGLRTAISNEGGLLSTGQRRRLLAARAICRGVPLLLLDEITANLDPATEEALVAGLMRVPAAKVFVTHSRQILPHMDRVYRIEGGRLIEDTTHRKTGGREVREPQPA